MAERNLKLISPLQRLEQGKDPIKAYDCSGLIMRFLEDTEMDSMSLKMQY